MSVEAAANKSFVRAPAGTKDEFWMVSPASWIVLQTKFCSHRRNSSRMAHLVLLEALSKVRTLQSSADLEDHNEPSLSFALYIEFCKISHKNALVLLG